MNLSSVSVVLLLGYVFGFWVCDESVLRIFVGFPRIFFPGFGVFLPVIDSWFVSEFVIEFVL